MQHEIGILDEKAPDAAKIDARKEILKVNIEYIPPLLMFYGVCDDRAISLEPVRQLIFPFAAVVDLFAAKTSARAMGHLSCGPRPHASGHQMNCTWSAAASCTRCKREP
jgi:hypothetical protein